MIFPTERMNTQPNPRLATMELRVALLELLARKEPGQHEQALQQARETVKRLEQSV